MGKILIIGDLHFAECLAYSHVVKDGRVSEQQEVLNFIVQVFIDNKCDKVVLLGDCFDKRNNPSPVIRMFTNFIERFDGASVYIIAGNHEKTPAGDSALDYLKEVKNKNWHIITDKIEKIDNMVFCPYLFKAEMGTESIVEATAMLEHDLLQRVESSKDLLFTHFAISDALTKSGISVNTFESGEIILSREKMEKMFLKIFAGHIHNAENGGGKTLITGSVFNEEIGETGKHVYIYNEELNLVDAIRLPGRGIYKINNPSLDKLDHLNKNNILKVFISERNIDLDLLREKLSKFDGYVLVEQYPNERRSVTYGNELMDLTIENLLMLYAKNKKANSETLLKTWGLIK